MTSYYTVDTLNPYMVRVEGVQNLEDATDVVYTDVEVSEMTGGTYVRYGVTIREKKVKAAIVLLRKKMITQNLTSIKIEDNDLVEALKASPYPLSDILKGLRRTGNRLSLWDNSASEAKKLRRSLFNRMCNYALGVFNRKNKIEVRMKYCEQDRHAAMAAIKNLITLDELMADYETIDKRYRPDEEHLVIIRQMWENLDEVFPPKVAQPA